MATILAVVALASLTLAAKEGPSWKAGVAKSVITPTKPIWLSGYAFRDHPAEGTIHDLWVKVLAMEDSQGRLAVLVTSDLLGLSKTISERICRQLQRAHQLERAQIVLTSTHTHSSPVLSGTLGPCYPLDAEQKKLIDEYTRWLEDQVAATVGQALSRRAPARLSFDAGKATFAVNRRNNREPEVPGLRAKGVELKGPVDHSVPVLAVHSTDGRLVAVAFGYACHNTNLNAYKWCGDYAGFAQIALEKQHPEATALFWSGCGADQNPLPRRSLPLCRAYGERLAAAVTRTLKGKLRRLDPKLSLAFETIPLEFEPFADRGEIEALKKSKSVLDRRWGDQILAQLDEEKQLPREYPYPIQVLRMGDALTWILLGGEVVVDYSLRFKKQFGDSTWVAGYANDVMAYIPSLRIQKEGGYEAAAMHVYGLPAKGWSRDVEERVVRGVERLVGQASK